MSNKQFEPTPQRLRKAYADGKTKRSQLLAGSLLSLIVVFGIAHIVRFRWVRIQLLIECLWSEDFNSSWMCVREVASSTVNFLISGGIFALIIVVCVQWLQVGAIWSPTSVSFDARRISLERGISRLGQGFQRLPAILAKLSIILCLGFIGLIFILPLYFQMQQYSFSQYPYIFADYSYHLLMAACIMLLLFGIHDLFNQRKQFREQVYMSHEEMHREHKESEGDPHFKAHRRSLQNALARQDLIRQIKRSKVIIVERNSVQQNGTKGA